jgi:2-haloacid dehalogenase
MTATHLKAIVFDVFGTLVDWRTSIANEVRDTLGAQGICADWHQFALDWRAEYQGAMEEVRSGRIPFCKLDRLHRRNLDIVVDRLGLQHMDEATRQHLTLAWHRLDAWPDVAPGLQRLRQHYWLAPCSNGHIALMVNLARRNQFVWDAILGADLAKDYKPKPIVYTSCADAFDIRPDQILMVAAHSSDLKAAAAAGLRTAFLARPDEYGPGGVGESKAGAPVDLQAKSLLDLAEQLGA